MSRATSLKDKDIEGISESEVSVSRRKSIGRKQESTQLNKEELAETWEDQTSPQGGKRRCWKVTLVQMVSCAFAS